MRRKMMLKTGLALPVLAAVAAATHETRVEAGDDPIAAATRRIDELVESGLAEAGVRPGAPVDDATFVRRVYLDVIGRIPTAAEAERFLASRERDKRARLVDELLDSPGYTSHAYHFWADLLRIKTRLAQRVSGDPYAHFIKSSIAEDKPYDEMVRELLTASGPAHARDNGATGYYMRDLGMPEDNMSNTVRVFLGTRIECAQCHDHPFEQWKQKEYFQMVAFTGGIQYRQRPRDIARGDGSLMDLAESLREEHGDQARRALFRVLQPVLAGVEGSGTGAVKLPDNYAYDDAEPGEWVTAKTIFDGMELDVKKDGDRGGKRRKRPRRFRPVQIDSRAAFADWLTSRDNPRFTKVIANRMWKRFFGRGVIEPVDDLREAADESALLACLEELMLDVDYDLKAFQRILLNTRAYQREAYAADDGFAFQGPMLRRMTAEEVWDSLLTLVVPDLDDGIDVTGAKRAEEVFTEYESIASLDEDVLRERVDLQVLRYTDREAFRERMRDARRAKGERDREKRREARPLYRKLRKAMESGNLAEARRIRDELEARGAPVPGDRRRVAGQLIARASELPSPAPEGHFLRQFGQSDRDQIETSNTDANVPQVLAFLNGELERYVLQNDESVVMRAIEAAGSAKDEIRAAFASVLCREPSHDELALWKDDFARDPVGARRDLVWVLVNTHEFLFIQ